MMEKGSTPELFDARRILRDVGSRRAIFPLVLSYVEGLITNSCSVRSVCHALIQIDRQLLWPPSRPPTKKLINPWRLQPPLPCLVLALIACMKEDIHFARGT